MTSTEPSSFDQRQARRVLIAAMVGMLATGFPFTILTVALGVIAEDFGVSEGLVAWTVSAPMLISAAALPVLGKLGDMYGHRRLFLWGIIGSSLFAGLCMVAWDIWSLIAFRVFSIVLASATGPSAMALLLHTYPEEHRTQAISWWSMSSPGSAALGLVLGGPCVDWFGWQSVFLIQAGAGVFAWILAARVLPETERSPAVFDHVGNIILLGALMCVLFVVGSLSEEGVSDALRIGIAIAAAIGLAAFFHYEGNVANPIVPPRLFQIRNFNTPIIAYFFLQLAYTGALIATPLVLIDHFGYSISLAASLMLVRTAALTFASPVAGKISEWQSERFCVQLGILLQTGGLALVGVGIYLSSIEIVIIGLLWQGVGHGFALPPINTIIASAVSPSIFGTASGVSRLGGQVGASFGISLFGVLLAYPSTIVSLPMIFGIGAAISLLSFVPGAAIARNKPPATLQAIRPQAAE